MNLALAKASLNANQSAAVTSSASGRLQIIAGPGTGKTKVLVARVAYLLLHQKIPPQRLIVTTFTKKAAAEMIERLTPMVQGSSIDLNKLLIGTFHSICYRIIRQFGQHLGIHNYTIADDRDSTQLITQVLNDLSSEDQRFLDSLSKDETEKFAGAESRHSGYEPKAFKRAISSLKSAAMTVEKYSASPSPNRCLELVYRRYQEWLRKNFLLDFDDCLLECHRLITQYPILGYVEHVLVDEFQDTNEVQLQLMYAFAKGHPTDPQLQNNVTIVGDPDQSIYAFRDAQSKNFQIMKSYYQRRDLDVKQIMLDQNYRSTSDILSISEALMRQQGDRVQKKLKSQLDTSFKPVHTTLDSQRNEARWLAYQILHLKALPNLFKYSEMAILVRSAYQTRAIEAALVSCGIPYYMIRGKAFWERKEVRAIVDYLRAIGNPNDRLAYFRSVNLPKRGVGDRSLQAIDEYIAKKGLVNSTVHDRIRELASGKVESKIPSNTRSKILEYIQLIEECRGLLGQYDKSPDPSILTAVFETAYTKSGLKAEHTDIQSSQEKESTTGNVQEVLKYLLEFVPQDDKVLGEEEVEVVDERNHLNKFITSIGLFESEKDDQQEVDRVAVSTIHGSKGLEWPVVFVPGLSEGLLPASFALRSKLEEEVNEERRCFYVATTRAKLLLYISSVVETNSWEGYRMPLEKESRFLKKIKDQTTQVQSVFSEWKHLKKLYELHGSKDIGKFDWETFNQGYIYGLDEFLRENRNAIDPFNWTGSRRTTYRPPSPPRKTPQQSADDKRKYNDIVEARKRLKQRHQQNQRPQGQNGVNGMGMRRGFKTAAFKPPRPMAAPNTSGKSRAPSYVPEKRIQ